MNRALALLGSLPAFLLAAGCSEDPHRQLRKVDLPGFSIQLPEGEIVTSGNSPTDGKHAVSVSMSMWSGAGLLASQELEVHWSNRAFPPEVWSQRLLPSLASALSAGNPDAKVLEEKALGDDRWLYIVGTEDSPAGVGVVNCDPRFSVMVSYVRYQDRARLSAGLEDILRSVRCAVTDANRAPVLAATRLPAAFGRVESHLGAQAYRSIDGEYLGITTTSNLRLLDDVDGVRNITRATIHGMLGVEVGEMQIVPGGGADAATLLLRASRAGGSPLYVGYRRCASQSLAVGVLWMAPRTSDEDAATRMGWIGCPGAPSSSPPEFSEVAARACAEGNQDACKLSAAATD